MKTIVILELTHSKPIPDLADLAAQRVYNLSTLDDCIVVRTGEVQEAVTEPV